MRLSDYIGIARRRRRQIIATVLLLVAFMSAITLLSTPQYSSSTRLFISTSSATS